MTGRCAVLFPGQGAYMPGALASLAATESVIDETLAEVDRAVSRLGHPAVSQLLLDPAAPSLDELVAEAPSRLHMAIFAAETALFRLLTERHGLQPDVLLGHSFGELVALTAAGNYDLAGGVALVAARDDAFAAASPASGGMIALNISATRASQLCEALAEWEIGLAADNSPRQSVLSGPAAVLSRVEKAAEALGVRATRLRVPYAFHNRSLAQVADGFIRRAEALPTRPGRYLVYSAILGRRVENSHDTADLVAAHLTRPTRFTDAVRALHAASVDFFVECGLRGTLTDLVHATVPRVTALAPFRGRAEADAVASALRKLGSGTSDLAPAADVHTGPVSAQNETAGGTLDRVTAAGAIEAADSVPAEQIADDSPNDQPPTMKDIIGLLRELYAETLGYPPEVFTEDADLEADLGVDSIKQTEVFTRAVTHYGRRLPDDGARLTSYTTLEALAELMVSLPRAGEAQAGKGVR